MYGQSDLITRLDKYMQSKALFNNFNGAVLVARNDSLLLKKAYGLADREWQIPNTVNTKFRIASNTKQFTAACILQLEEQGKLSLNDKLSKYFTGFEYGDTITIHMLLVHSSGIQDYFHLKEFSFKPVVISKDSMVSLLKTKLFDFLPGYDLNYSNSGYFLLGMIVEKVSGQRFEDYLNQHILNPIGMANTGVDRYDTILTNRAKGYKGFPNNIINAFDQNYTWDLMFGAGSMYSTIEDLYKWEKSFQGTIILSEQSKIKMFTQYGFSLAEAKKKTNPDNTLPYNIDPFWHHLGYGVFIDTFFTHKRFFSRGGTSGFHSTIYSFPNDNSFVIVLQNNEERPDRIAEPLSAIMFGTDFSPQYKHTAYKINPASFKKYTGKWFGNIYGVNWTTEILIKNNKLYRRIEGYPDIELIPESESKFFYGDGQDKQMEFILDEKGKLTNAWFILDGIKFKRERIK